MTTNLFEQETLITEADFLHFALTFYFQLLIYLR
jgi:hypothetical protein